MRNTREKESAGSVNFALATAKDSKGARVEIRTSPDMKEKLRAAASLAGVDMSSYILTIVAPEVNKALSDQRLRVLSEQEWERMAEILNSTKEPGDKLRNLMSRKPRYERHY